MYTVILGLAIVSSLVECKTLQCTDTWDFEIGGSLSVVLESPDYPQNYPNKKRCIWDLIIPPGADFTIQCSMFHVDPTDFFCVEDYNNWGYNCWHGYNGNGYLPLNYVRSYQRNLMKLKFKSNGYNNAPGFR